MHITIEQIRDQISDRFEVAAAWTYGVSGGTNGRNRRFSGSTAVVLLLHALLFWGLLTTHQHQLDLSVDDDIPISVEMWQPAPPPPEDPVKPKLRQDIQPVEQPPQPQEQTPVKQKVERPVEPPVRPMEAPKPVAQPQFTSQSAAVPALQPNVVDAPRPTLTVRPVEMPDFIPSHVPTTQQQTQRDLANDSRPAPTVAAAPSPNLGVKKKDKDEALQAKANDTAAQLDKAVDLSALNLHAPPALAPEAPPSAITPSGLAAGGAKPAGGSVGGVSGTLPPGALQGANGALKGGRSGVSQAIQNHNSCVSIQIKGQKPPEDCKMSDLASMGSLGPKPDGDFQAAAARRDADLKYKTSAGNTEYWQRVNQSPQPGSAGRDDGLPKKGAYSSSKDQRVLTGSGTDSAGGN